MSAILVAGIGNIFNGDDAFGVEVAQRLMRRSQPTGVKVVDFGIRGIDLTYALLEGYDAVILVDAAARGHSPGTVSVVQPTAPTASQLQPEDLIVSAHDLDPAKVLQMVAALGGGCRRVVLVACEPRHLGGTDGAMGLSPLVEMAIEPAIATVEQLLAEFLTGASLGEAA
ncbi:Hydrogenase+maturation+protease+HcyI/HyaD/HybD+familiy [Methylocapsa aurea]|uniref:hydrogenase maturation protease n=1 Tax=Methylocapsa aurea TaxID=663610 RepID=UPI003D18EB36